jgi:hypothetical protein
LRHGDIRRNCKRSLQFLVVLNHGSHHWPRHTNIGQVNNLFRTQVKGVNGIGNKRQHHRLAYAGIGELYHFADRTARPDICRHRLVG